MPRKTKKSDLLPVPDKDCFEIADFDKTCPYYINGKTVLANRGDGKFFAVALDITNKA